MAQGSAVTYEVTGVAPDTNFTGVGSPVPGKRITFTTSTGYAGTVFVPDSVVTDAAAVRRIIEAEVKTVAMVAGITGTLTVA